MTSPCLHFGHLLNRNTPAIKARISIEYCSLATPPSKSVLTSKARHGASDNSEWSLVLDFKVEVTTANSRLASAISMWAACNCCYPCIRARYISGALELKCSLRWRTYCSKPWCCAAKAASTPIRNECSLASTLSSFSVILRTLTFVASTLVNVWWSCWSTSNLNSVVGHSTVVTTLPLWSLV